MKIPSSITVSKLREKVYVNQDDSVSPYTDTDYFFLIILMNY